MLMSIIDGVRNTFSVFLFLPWRHQRNIDKLNYTSMKRCLTTHDVIHKINIGMDEHYFLFYSHGRRTEAHGSLKSKVNTF